MMISKPKSMSRVEAARIPVSRLVAFAILGILLLSSPAPRPALAADLLRVLGILLAAVGAFGRLWCSVYIGGRKTSELVTAGPYSLCRNPLYLFSFIGVLGVGLVSQSLTVILLIAAFLALYYPGVIRSEELKLTGVHGAAFTRYCAATPALLPHSLRVLQEVPRTVDVALFRRHALEAIWFVWAVALVMLLEVLHGAGLLPALFSVY